MNKNTPLNQNQICSIGADGTHMARTDHLSIVFTNDLRLDFTFDHGVVLSASCMINAQNQHSKDQRRNVLCRRH